MATTTKFFRLGAEKGVKRSTYESYLPGGANYVDGAIIFAKVNEVNANGSWTDVDGVKSLIQPSYFIWANGIEYKVANADALEWVIGQMKTLTAGADVEGSIRYIIEQYLQDYKVTADDINNLINHDESNVDVQVVDGSLVINAQGTALKITEGEETPEDYVANNGIIPSKGEYYVKLTKVVNDELDPEHNNDAEPMRTTYIYDGTRWVATDGNVDFDHVYTKGLKRTAAWGVKSATDGDIIEECKNYTLQEVFDFYLIEEIYPEPTKREATFTDATLGTLSFNASLKSADQYLTWENSSIYKVSGTDIKVPYGTKFEVNAITLANEKINTNGFDATSAQGLSNHISGLTYGYKETKESNEIKFNELDGGNLVSATYEYDTTKLSDDTTTITLKSSGFGVKSTSGDTATTTGNVGTAKDLSIAKNTENVAYATTTASTFTVTLETDATATRKATYTPTDLKADGISEVYIVSNKGGVSDDHKTSLADKTFTPATNNNVASPSKQTKSVKITGVWPVYIGWSTDSAYATGVSDWSSVNIPTSSSAKYSNITNTIKGTYETAVGMTAFWVAVPSNLKQDTMAFTQKTPPTQILAKQANVVLNSLNGIKSQEYVVYYFTTDHTSNKNTYDVTY